MRLVTRAQWGAAPGRGTDRLTLEGVMIHWMAGNPSADHNGCPAQVRNMQRMWMNQGHKDMAYNALVCIHGYVFEGRPMRTAGSANGVGRLGTNVNARFVSVCALLGPGNPQGERLHNAIRDAVNWVAGWGLGPVRQVVPHSANIATQCPGDELRALIARGAFNPGRPPQPPDEGLDMTPDELRAIIRSELNQGQVQGVPVPQGVSGFGATLRWIGQMLRDQTDTLRRIETRVNR